MGQHEHITLDIEGMTCNNCALGVRKYLEKQGMENVHVSFANGEASFNLNGYAQQQLNDLIEGINNLGFQVLEEEAPEKEQKGLSLLEWKLIVSAFFTIPLFLAMFLPFPILHEPLVQLALCLPVFIIAIQHFGISAYHSLKTGVPNMDVLIIIGVTAAFVYSLVGLLYNLGHDFMFWETAATITTLVLLGNYMEFRSVKQTTQAVKELQKLQPETAKLVSLNFETNEESVEDIHIKQIKRGNVLLVNTGDSIPADGIVVWGGGTVDEAMMTGESQPVEKQLKSKVTGGTILTTGSIKMRAERVGKQTTLSEIIRLVKEAQADQPPIQKLADKISAVFVPVVVSIALLTFLLAYFVFNVPLSKALLNSIAVLVISCPCAMGLATPTAVMVGIGRAAKNGILIKKGSILETLANVKNMVFDKTGTLTDGTFQLKEFNTFNGHNVEDSKAALLGLEKHSTHPLAKSVVSTLEKEVKALHFFEVKETKGLGLKGKDRDGNVYTAGSYRTVEALTKDNSHNIYLSKNNELIAWFDLEDRLRPHIKESIASLKNKSVTPVLLSGDLENKTAHIARQSGIDNYHGRKLPEEKLAIIDKLKTTGITAMVGDGINDAPALAKSDIGISLGNASQVAIESADVVLLNDQLENVNLAVDISKHTVLTIKQNLFWAFFYNVLAIPIAAVGLLNPMIAALAMAFSDVIVIGNSLRLKKKKLS